MNATILVLGLLGQVEEGRLDPATDLPEQHQFRRALSADVAARREAYVIRKAEQRERDRDYRAQQKLYARQLITERAQQAAQGRRYRIATGAYYRNKYAQLAALRNSSLHPVAYNGGPYPTLYQAARTPYGYCLGRGRSCTPTRAAQYLVYR